MLQAFHRLEIQSRGRGLIEFTADVRSWAGAQAISSGLLTLFCRHTSASLLIQENADPDVRADLEAFFGKIAPDGAGLYRHDTEGPDDMPAHIRSALTQPQLSIPVHDGALSLGTWQGVYLFEHRTATHRRQIVWRTFTEAGLRLKIGKRLR